MIQLPKVLTGYFSTAKLNSALTMIEDWFNNNVVHRKNGSAVMEQDLDMNGNSIINATVGTDPSSLVNRAYVDKTLPAMEANAVQSANEAAASEIAASIHEANTLTYLKEFRDTYLGSYASAPTTDPDGNPVNIGDLYFDTTLNEMRVWDGASWKSVAGSLVGSPETAQELAGGVDLNIVTTPGFYVQSQDVDAASGTNYPVPLAGSLMVLKNASGVSQIYYTYGSSARVFFRALYNNSWSSWKEIYHSGNLPGWLSANGYQKLPGGLIIQWGFTTVSSVTFPIAFPNAVLNASATKGVNTNTSAVDTAPMAIEYVTKTGMNVVAYKAGDRTYQGVMWIAIGY